MKENEKSAELISQDDIDSLLSSLSSKGKSVSTPNSARIILEEDDENEKADSEISSPKIFEYKGPWYILKLRWICASTALVFFAGVLSYFIFLGLNPNIKMRPPIYRFPIVQPSSPALDKFPKKKRSCVSVSMKDFVVPTPRTIEGLTYLAADISIELKNRSDLIKIKEKQAYARSLIYNAFEQSLSSDIKKDVEKSQLEEAIKTVLGDIVPKQFIKKVTLKKFRLI